MDILFARELTSENHISLLESEEQNSPTASVGSVNHDPSDQFQDAQDPYSGYDLDKI